MSKSLPLKCLGRFFHPDKIHTSTSRKPIDIFYSCWQTAAVADFFTMKEYTFQLVDSLAKYAVVVCNLRLINNILRPDKITTSQVESPPPT